MNKTVHFHRGYTEDGTNVLTSKEATLDMAESLLQEDNWSTSSVWVMEKIADKLAADRDLREALDAVGGW